MEALTAATIALLTIYDMCKGVDRDMVISEVRLMEKRGGKAVSPAYRVAGRGRVTICHSILWRDFWAAGI